MLSKRSEVLDELRDCGHMPNCGGYQAVDLSSIGKVTMAFGVLFHFVYDRIYMVTFVTLVGDVARPIGCVLIPICIYAIFPVSFSDQIQ